MSLTAVLPVAVPLAAAALGFAAWRSVAVQRVVGVGGAAALLVSALTLLWEVLTRGTQVAHVGNWPAPFGITLVADLLGAVLVCVTAVVGAAVAVYSLTEVDRARQSMTYFPLFHVLLAGVCGAFLTGDLFNLFVWFEVMLIASFVLLALGGTRAQMEGALKYVTLNLISSAVFLIAVGLLYGMARTLNMADLSMRLPGVQAEHPHLVLAVASMFLFSFGIKAGLFPLYFWLPASYPTPSASVTAVFAGLLTKVGVYALIRVFTIVFPPMERMWSMLLVLAGLTMVIGVLGAVAQFEFRRILSFHILSQIGYMVMGLGLLVAPDPSVRRLALLAAVFYIVHHILVKTNLFLVAGVVRRVAGGYDLGPLGGLATRAPVLAVLFLVPALSLAGIPPLSGFWAKLAIVRAGLEAEQYWMVAAALFAGLLTLISMIKIWNEAFWKAKPAGDEVPGDGPSRGARSGRALLLVPIAAMAVLTIAIGLYPAWLFGVAERVADELLDPAGYVRAVMG